MYKIGKNKKLAKLVTASFALNAIGGMALPVTTSATSLVSDTYYANLIAEANKIEDDVEFLNKIVAICTQGGMNGAENYKTFVDGAKAIAEDAEDRGVEPDAATKGIIAADERIRRIAKSVSNAGTISFGNASSEDVAKAAAQSYQKALDEKKACESEAEKAGKDKGECVMSTEGAAAANYLMTTGLRQVNVSSTEPTSTTVAEAKGASKIENKESHWVRGEDGLYHEVTTVTVIECGEGEIVSDGKCVEKPKEGESIGHPEGGFECKEGEALVDGKCMPKPSDADLCGEGYEARRTLENKVDCVSKCGDTETFVDGKCVPTNGQPEEKGPSETQCKDTEALVDGKCVPKDSTNNPCGEGEQLVKESDDLYSCVKKCDEGEMLVGGKCIPKDGTKDETPPEEKPAETPQPAAETQQPAAETPQPAAETPQPAAENGGGGGGKSMNPAAILGALGAIGALAGAFGGGPGGPEGDLHSTQGQEDVFQYAFNYTTRNEQGTYLFPMNAADDVKFALFKYGLPKAGEGQKAQPIAKLHVTMTILSADGKWTPKTVPMGPLEIGKPITAFPGTTGDVGTVFMPLKEFGTIERVPASTFGLPYYTMMVIAEDGIPGHRRWSEIHYDFVGSDTRIERIPDDAMKEHTFDVSAKEPTIAFDGTIAGAEWDATNKTCRISVNGTFTSPQDRHDTKEGEAYDIVSERYDQSGCEAIASEKGSFFTIDRLKVIDDGKGGTILSDSDKEATAALFKDETDYRNYKEQKYTEGVLNYTNYKPEYQENLSYSCVPQIIKPFNNNTGERETWHGYSVCLEHGVPVLRDSNGVAVTATQAAEEARFVCEKTGDEDACNAVRIDACSANHDPEKLGMICAFDKNGKETVISGEGFPRSVLEAYGTDSSKRTAMERIKRNTAQSGSLMGTLRGYLDRFEDLVGVGASNEKKSISEISGEESNEDQKKRLTEEAKDGSVVADGQTSSKASQLSKEAKAIAKEASQRTLGILTEMSAGRVPSENEAAVYKNLKGYAKIAKEAQGLSEEFDEMASGAIARNGSIVSSNKETTAIPTANAGTNQQSGKAKEEIK